MNENSTHSDFPKPESTTCAETEEEVRIDKAGEQLRVQIARSRLLWSLYTSGSWEFVHHLWVIRFPTMSLVQSKAWGCFFYKKSPILWKKHIKSVAKANPTFFVDIHPR